MKKIFFSLTIYLLVRVGLMGQDCLGPNSNFVFNTPTFQMNNDLFNQLIYSKDLIKNKSDGPSLLFDSNFWVGGVNKNGITKFAGRTYAFPFSNFDFYPGPLDDNGNTISDQCEFWDRYFFVKKSEIETAYQLMYTDDGELKTDRPCELIPKSILEWPGQGNQNLAPFVPDHAMADFFDENGNGIYEPCNGDLPVLTRKDVEIDSPNEVLLNFPAFLAYQILNDNGGDHLLSAGEAMQIELHQYFWGIDEVFGGEEALYMRCKVTNRGSQSFDNFGISFWADSDLGCAFDDFAGTIPERNLVFYYNEDAIDGNNGSLCSGGVSTFNDNPPILGITILEGINVEDGSGNKQDLKNTSTMFNFNAGTNPPPGSPIDPQGDDHQFYRVMQGLNRTGEPIIENGDSVKYMFTGNPADPTSNAICNSSLNSVDLRTVMSSLGGELPPGGSQELTLSLFLTFKANHPCPDISPLLEAQDKVIEYYNNNYKTIQPIDPPVLDYQRNSNTINLTIINEATSNNSNETYSELIPNAPSEDDQYLYRFEGYKVYQVVDPDITIRQLDDPALSQLVYQTDIQNGISTIVNYTSQYSEINGKSYQPLLKVDGENEGIKHSFTIDYDYLRFRPIQRNEEYYYVAIAYAYNNYQAFNITTGTGQQYPYIQSVTPKPTNVPPAYDNETFAPVITRLHGMGSINELYITEASRQAILDGTFNGKIVYEPNKGPFDVTVVDSTLLIGKNKFRVQIEGPFDDKTNICAFEAEKTSVTITDLSDGSTYTTFTTLPDGDHYFEELGLIIHIPEVVEPGSDKQRSSGFISQSKHYSDDQGPDWLGTLTGEEAWVAEVNDIQLDPTVIQNDDKYGVYSGEKQRYAFPLYATNLENPMSFAISPGNHSTVQLVRAARELQLQHLNNVDIVFTDDKSLWSRCIVVETASKAYQDQPGIGTNRNFLTVKYNASLGKDGMPDQTGFGMSWFPGYAIDVETGERLNIFFGENTALSSLVSIMEDKQVSNDMLFNPTSQLYVDDDATINPYLKAILGGQHFVYVTSQTYDECKLLEKELSESIIPFYVLGNITWTFIPYLNEGTSFLPIEEGLIPNEVRLSLRVNNPFSYQLDRTSLLHKRCEPIGETPTYEFELTQNQMVNVEHVLSKSTPWNTATNINYFRLFDLDEEVMVTLMGSDGRVIQTWDIQPNNDFKIDHTNLPNANMVGFVNVKSKTDGHQKTYKIVLVE